ncbi:class I SAM-dependent DNA methyltransferase [Acuticoccus sp.]|uniref:class I SAM-dependent DNA methyltransferase n=1 Tax=Acuticoccus sp. TaxID=1904378 RepID=UPI003B52E397
MTGRPPPPGTLAGAYGPSSTEETRAFYEGWADGYEADTLGEGFRVPLLASAFLARHAPPDAGPVLDAACGTGLVGDALRLLGYAPLAGCDLSPAMLARARARGVYDALAEANLTALPYGADAFATTACAGAFGPGHAPPAALGELVRVTRPGGVVAFNVRADTWQDQGFAAAIDDLSQHGAWREVDRSPTFPVYLLNDLDLSAILFVFRIA